MFEMLLSCSDKYPNTHIRLKTPTNPNHRFVALHNNQEKSLPLLSKMPTG
jgi:hypothetical protein